MGCLALKRLEPEPNDMNIFKSTWARRPPSSAGCQSQGLKPVKPPHMIFRQADVFHNVEVLMILSCLAGGSSDRGVIMKRDAQWGLCDDDVIVSGLSL